MRHDGGIAGNRGTDVADIEDGGWRRDEAFLEFGNADMKTSGAAGGSFALRVAGGRIEAPDEEEPQDDEGDVGVLLHLTGLDDAFEACVTMTPEEARITANILLEAAEAAEIQSEMQDGGCVTIDSVMEAQRAEWRKTEARRRRAAAAKNPSAPRRIM